MSANWNFLRITPKSPRSFNIEPKFSKIHDILYLMIQVELQLQLFLTHYNLNKILPDENLRVTTDNFILNWRLFSPLIV